VQQIDALPISAGRGVEGGGGGAMQLSRQQKVFGKWSLIYKQSTKNFLKNLNLAKKVLFL
jgi:hypothetical protein